MKNIEWDHKDEWKLVSADFCLVVSRHSVNLTGLRDDEGEHRWCIYVYIYPKHPLFSKFDGGSIWQDAADLGLHGGCNFLRYHYSAGGAVTSIQVGCDYNHLGDERYTQMENKSEAWRVFNDASNIFEKVKSMEIAE